MSHFLRVFQLASNVEKSIMVENTSENVRQMRQTQIYPAHIESSSYDKKKSQKYIFSLPLVIDLQSSSYLKIDDFGPFSSIFSVVGCCPKMGRNSMNMCPMTMKLIFLDSWAQFASKTTSFETLHGPEGKTYLGVLAAGNIKV